MVKGSVAAKTGTDLGRHTQRAGALGLASSLELFNSSSIMVLFAMAYHEM